jgi:replicative DNA helicase
LMPPHLETLEQRKRATANTGSFGLADLDGTFRGLRPGRFTIIAGRPGTGKSLLGLCIARATSITMRAPSLLVSLEMPTDEVLDRLLAAEARVELGHIADGELTEADWHRIAKALPRLADAPLHIDDSEHITLAGLRNTVRTLRRGPGCELVIVDYLQLMEAPRAQNREQSVAQVSRGLKLMAREFDIPVVALCQLNRGPEQRTDKRPMKSDLRESGSLEQDADNVILLHRPELYGEEDRAGEIDLIVDKHRGGHLFTAKAAFLGHHGCIANMARHGDWSPSDAAGLR